MKKYVNIRSKFLYDFEVIYKSIYLYLLVPELLGGEEGEPPPLPRYCTLVHLVLAVNRLHKDWTELRWRELTYYELGLNRYYY